MTDQPPPYGLTTPPPSNPSAMKSLWPLTIAIAGLFIANIVIRFMTVANSTAQINAAKAFRKSQSLLDLAKIQDADTNVTPLTVGAIATWVAAAILLSLWIRGAVANHQALGRFDDRYRGRNGSKAPSALDFAGTAAMAMRGNSNTTFPHPVAKTERFFGFAPAAWWERTFMAAFIIGIISSNFTRLQRSEDINDVLNQVERGRAVMTGVAALIVVAGALGIYVMTKVAQAHSAAASDPSQFSA